MEIKSSLKTLAIVGALSSATTLGAYKLFLEKSPSESVITNSPSAFTRLVSDVSPTAPSNPVISPMQQRNQHLPLFILPPK